MFLSALVSHLELDGSLTVDLTDEHGPVLKFGALGEGMPWARLEGGQWVPAGKTMDGGSFLALTARTSKRNPPSAGRSMQT